MIDWSSEDRPARATIDSRAVRAGDLFVGLPGENVDGGAFAAQALAAGAWGVLVAPEHAEGLTGGHVLVAGDPLRALQDLATAWAIAARRSRIGSPWPPMPARISSTMSLGSSERGLSDVTIATSASSSAMRPMIGRLPRSRSPPQPNTHTTRRDAISRAARRTFSSESGVCE